MALLQPLQLTLEIAGRVCLGLCCVRAPTAKRLHAVPMAELSRLDAVVHHVLVFLLQMAKAIRVPRLPVVHRLSRLQTAKATRALRLRRALPSLRAVAGTPVCLFRVQMVTAKRLTRAPVLHPGPGSRDHLYLAGQA